MENGLSSMRSALREIHTNKATIITVFVCGAVFNCFCWLPVSITRLLHWLHWLIKGGVISNINILPTPTYSAVVFQFCLFDMNLFNCLCNATQLYSTKCDARCDVVIWFNFIYRECLVLVFHRKHESCCPVGTRCYLENWEHLFAPSCSVSG